MAQLQQEIQHLKSTKEWTPQARQYTALQNRIVEMERESLLSLEEEARGKVFYSLVA